MVGQQAQRSKFDKYLQSTNVTAMQLALISANLDIIRQSTSSEIGVGVPEVYYDPKTRSLSAAAIVTDELTKKPVAQVRGTLLGLAGLWLNDVQRYMPDVSKENIKITFPDFGKESLASGNAKVFAEY